MNGTTSKKSHAGHQDLIYQYQLLKRFSYSPLMISSFLLLFLVGEAALLYFSPLSITDWMVDLFTGIVLVLFLQSGVAYVALQRISNDKHNAWGIRTNCSIFWVGYLPRQDIAIRLLLSVQFHQMFVVLLGITLLLPWVATSLLLQCLFVHLWFSLPRIIMLIRCYYHRKDGIVRLSSKDLSYYVS
ncbi:hypothetical protein [Marinicrinis sediminis]|uniref:Uncharacterized protein n=1 Tax=Marinicrinis sediminis TaxID=1652465 RepID=A0ABW5R9Z1_9BACL